MFMDEEKAEISLTFYVLYFKLFFDFFSKKLSKTNNRKKTWFFKVQRGGKTQLHGGRPPAPRNPYHHTGHVLRSHDSQSRHWHPESGAGTGMGS